MLTHGAHVLPINFFFFPLSCSKGEINSQTTLSISGCKMLVELSFLQKGMKRKVVTEF